VESSRYLIIGGGMTGDAAVRGIRERDADSSIVLVGAEQHPPYARPPLTKGLWSGADEAKTWRGTEDAGADLRLGRRIVSLDLNRRRATDDAGEEYTWETLLLAAGGRPRTIPGADGVATIGRSTTTGLCERGCTRARAPS
jgi:3-phenylpropionate/trans-cinnamate dioxygenase ferredoxin reductase subunit